MSVLRNRVKSSLTHPKDIIVKVLDWRLVVVRLMGDGRVSRLFIDPRPSTRLHIAEMEILIIVGARWYATRKKWSGMRQSHRTLTSDHSDDSCSLALTVFRFHEALVTLRCKINQFYTVVWPEPKRFSWFAWKLYQPQHCSFILALISCVDTYDAERSSWAIYEPYYVEVDEKVCRIWSPKLSFVPEGAAGWTTY